MATCFDPYVDHLQANVHKYLLSVHVWPEDVLKKDRNMLP